MSGERLLVPVSDSSTIRQTVEYAVNRALADGDGSITFVFAHSPEIEGAESTASRDTATAMEDADALLDRVVVWANEDAGERESRLEVETGHIGLDELLFSPEDIARALGAEAEAKGFDHIILDPEYDPGIGAPLVRPLEYELTRFPVTVEEAPAGRQTQRLPLLVRSSSVQIGSLFLISLFFYMILAADPFYWFEWVTGIISATVVAFGLSRVTFSEDPSAQTLVRIGRHAIYIPYLLYEIVKANILVAAVILHPRLPIEPRLTRIRPAVWGGLPITTLANSITLTPGTLSVRIDGDQLVVHTLIPDARDDLFDGGLERAVRFVFYGRKAANIPTPKERGDTEMLQGPDSAADESPDVEEGTEDERADVEEGTENKRDTGNDSSDNTTEEEP